MCDRIRAGSRGELFVVCLVMSAVSLACTHPARRSGQNQFGGAGTTSSGFAAVGGTATPGLSGAAGTTASTPAGGNGPGPMSGPRDEVVTPTPSAGSGGAATMPPPVVKMACGPAPYNDPWSPGYKDDPAALMQAKSTAASLTLPEKADQMRGTPKGNGQYTDIFRTLDNPAKGIKGFLFRDGPRGVNLAAGLASGKQGYATAFPVSMARGASFDMDLEARIGAAIGDETLASGNTMILAPTVNILRHPAWGRAQETYGEDPFLLGRLGSAFVVGAQQYVPACVKHYAANNIENGRESANAMMDEQTLREIYARHFEMIVRDGGVACVMAAYNQVNGSHSTQNKHLLTDILRTDFGFKGFTLSDWWAMPGGRDVNAATASANAQEAILAGLDMELPWALNYVQIEAITGPGRPLTEVNVTDAATRILEQKYRYKVANISGARGRKAPKTTFSGSDSIENNQEHIALAQEAALKSMTLLKNDNKTLPIDRTKVKNIAVIGAVVTYTVADTNDQNNGRIDFAVDPRLGDLGSSRVFADPAKSTGPFAGIKNVAGPGIQVVSGASAALADQADFVVVVAGLTPQDEGEEYTRAGDRANFALDGKGDGSTQNNLIAQIAAKGKPMVVVLEGGSVIDMPWLAQVPAVVMAWYPGMDGGNALGKLLFGDAAFSGKLPITWPKRWEDEPVFSSGTTTAMDYYLGYRHFDMKRIEPLFPFGHGLSYTTFEYKNLQLPCSSASKDSVVQVSLEVSNTGLVAADEVVFLFVSYPATKQRRPIKELKGFYRVSVAAGQTKRVTIPLRVSDLKYWDGAANRWNVESGPVKVMVGPSAARLPLEDTFTVD
ncbi:MAG TPA: glycoside hydrolase family 3 C-terminal domain-containing protein [Polyangiales bacterium]|nr:glycoside hydrolase family 3 C-terminal domain-containing protein [Polyangiales bacterium]